MDARARRSLVVLLVLASGAGSVAASAQRKRVEPNTSRTVRKVRVAEEDKSVAPAVIQAETAIEKQDLAKAESLLTNVVDLDPRDYRAWFDLAYVFNVTGRKAQAIEAYKKSLSIKPSVQEANLNLGLLLAGEGKNEEAAKYLRAATTLKPDSKDTAGIYRAWMGLGQVLQTSAPQEALSAFRQAERLDGKDIALHLAMARLLEKSDAAGAEAEYKKSLDLDRRSNEAIAGLVQLYIRAERLSEAEAFLREYLKLSPEDGSASLELGRLLIKAGKAGEALDYYAAGLKARPEDPGLLKAVAALYAQAQKYPEAAERYRLLVKAAPTDADAHRDLARVLMKLQQFPEAEAELFAAIKLEPKNAETYGEFAIVAAQNKKFALAIRALEERAKYAPEIPATYFLRATSYDNLRVYKEAAENYRQFLAVAGGKFPDQEWQARHRLIAIEPEQKKK